MPSLNLVFVHGWSVTNLNTYGELPLRLRAEAVNYGLNLQVREIFLGRYISFNDAVRFSDIARAFRTAVNEQLADIIQRNERFICIAHSTGGPAIRDWWQRYYLQTADACPMSHLIMLAPANNGSALAQLGKGRLSRLRSFFEGIEPGQGVLDWLELGSAEAWTLNKQWIMNDGAHVSVQKGFPFVLAGEYIDRKFYDHLNSYTGEMGSDGVVRTASANLETRYIKLQQPVPFKDAQGNWATGDFLVSSFDKAPALPLRVVEKKAHSGEEMGIMRSVKAQPGNDGSSETVKAIFDCINVTDKAGYDALYVQFTQETAAVQQKEKVELEDRLLLSDRFFIHDKHTMVIFRVLDTEGNAVTDYDLILTAGDNSDPNHLPKGFCVDRQRNQVNPETITYFFNYDIMNGSDAVKYGDKELRPKLIGIKKLGLQIQPRPDSGFVRYLPCSISATSDMFDKVLVPNSTTLIEICLQRLVSDEVFRLEPLPGDAQVVQGSFKDVRPGNDWIA